ncbi:MAG: hypothetical protein Q8K65_04100 [Alphaproteobacteria bacterium]|nr:hypothetical protein [Alphaproteobacteria bacterium]
MAGKRRLQDQFKRAARKSLLVSAIGIAALAGCSGTPVRKDLPDGADMHRPVAAVTLPKNADGRKLGAETEAIFRRNMPVPVNENLSEQSRINAYLDQLCFTTQSTPKEEQRAMRRALEDLSKLPLTGRPLVEMAAKENIQFCNIQHLPAGMGAQYVPTLGAVLAPGTMNAEPMILRIAHEILHAAQDKNDLLNYHYDWDIHSRLARNLSIEAAALSFELLVAFEMKQQGDPKLWDHMRTRYAQQSSYGDARLYTLAEETWAQSKAVGKADDAALRDVGKALWTRMFDNAGWLDFYLNFELATYIRDVTSGALDDQRNLRSGGYSQSKTDNAGKIGSSESFTKDARVPTLEKLLSGNDKMRQAYAAVDLERHRRSLGADHPQTQALRRAALADSNPYLNVDFAAVLKQMQQNAFPDAEGKKKFAYLHEYMDATIKPARAEVAEAAPAPKEKPPEDRKPEAAPGSEDDAPRPVPPRDTLAQAKPAAQISPRLG